MNKNGCVISENRRLICFASCSFCDKVSRNHNVTIIVNCVIVTSYLFLYTVFTTSGSGYFFLFIFDYDVLSSFYLASVTAE
jgi:hypothetical protein